MKPTIIATAACVVAGIYMSAQLAYADGYHKASGFEQAKAYCELMADSMRTGNLAFGSPAFVAGASIGGAIRGAIDHANHYDACMTLKGYAKNQ
jgi:hypothetical protein